MSKYYFNLTHNKINKITFHVRMQLNVIQE